MAEKSYEVHINLNGNQVKESSFEKLASAPLSPFVGQNYYDTVLKLNRTWGGTAWISGGGGTQPDWNQTDNTAADYINNKPAIPVIDPDTVVDANYVHTDENYTTAEKAALANHLANTANPHSVTKTQVGLSNVDNTSDVNKPVSTAQQAAIDQAVSDLRSGVASAGDTLQKLYNIIIGQTKEISVANIAARDAYNIPALPVNVFVADDGDGTWALYKATTTGVGAAFVKLSDPDLLNAIMTASQIKVSYESNPDTNAFTNTLLSKLNAIAAGATANSTDAQLRDRSTHSGTQTASTISDFNSAALTAAPAETLTTEGALINSATTKTTPVDTDYIGLMDSAASNILKKLSWANIKATLKSYFDTLYALKENEAAISASAIDWNVTHSYKTLGANTTFTFSNAANAKTIIVAITNTASNYTVTWPTVDWGSLGAPTQRTGAVTDIYTFTQINGTIYGSVRQ